MTKNQWQIKLKFAPWFHKVVFVKNLPASTLSIPLFDADLGKVLPSQKMLIYHCVSSKTSLQKQWWEGYRERGRDPDCNSAQDKIIDN